MRVIASPAFKARALNPYTWFLYQELQELGVEVVEFSRRQLLFGERPDIWHLHWPEGFLKTRGKLHTLARQSLLELLLGQARRRGTKILWTVHNLAAHDCDHPGLERRFWRRFIPRLDGIINLSERGRRLALKKFPGLSKTPSFVIPHGHYREIYPDTVSRLEARRKLGLAEAGRVALFLGQIRPYKNLPRLLEVFSELKDQEAVLLLAGRVQDHALKEQVQGATRADPRIKARLELIPEEEVQLYLRASDLTVLPYGDLLNSGVALLSLSFDCPVLAPERGMLGELQQQVGARWLRLFPERLTVQTLREALYQPRPAERRPDLEAYGWGGIARATLEAYQTLCNQGRQP